MAKTYLGHLITTQKGYAFKSNDYTNKGIGIIRVSDFTDNSIDDSNLVYIDKNLATNFKQYRLETNDVIIQTVGSWPTNPQSVVGKVVRVPSRINGFLLNQNAVKLIPNKEIDIKYLYYLLKSSHFSSYIVACARGAASQASITLDDIKSYEFIKPDLKIQKKIAKILLNYDDLIENNNKRIKILEEMAQKIYKEWFVDFKFPNYETVSLKQTELGNEVMPRKGKNITKAKIKEGNTPVVAGGLEPAYYHNKSNTTGPVITVSASGANAGYINLYYQDIWASDCSFIDSTMTPYLYYYYLLLKYNQIKVTNMQRGAAQPHVYPQDLAQLKFNTTDEKIIKEFNILITPLFEQIKNLSLKNQILRQTRDILLSRLISGKIDVKNMEIK